MGVVNVTPDSFSDGGRYLDPQAALDQAAGLVGHGADIIDFGAESTRPGAPEVGAEEEWRRLKPVLEKAGSLGVPVSVDTSKPEIMLRAVDLGAAVINDVRGGADPGTLQALHRAQPDLIYLAMHMHGRPGTMQQQPLTAAAAVTEVEAFYERTRNALLETGFRPENIWLDPGIGFGKSDAANIRLLDQATRLAGQYQLVIGISRKSFLGRALGIPQPVDRDPPSKTLEMALMFAGVRAIRTHDVAHLAGLRRLWLDES